MNTGELGERLGDACLVGEAASVARKVLARAPVGYLAMSYEDWPYVVPISFAYEREAIYFHGGGSLKRSLLAADPRVCLAAVTQPEFMLAGSPCDDNFRYESVLAFGTVRLLEAQEERDRALRTIVAKYHPAAASASFTPNVFGGTLVYALTVEALTYKRNSDA